MKTLCIPEAKYETEIFCFIMKIDFFFINFVHIIYNICMAWMALS